MLLIMTLNLIKENNDIIMIFFIKCMECFTCVDWKIYSETLNILVTTVANCCRVQNLAPFILSEVLLYHKLPLLWFHNSSWILGYSKSQFYSSLFLGLVFRVLTLSLFHLSLQSNHCPSFTKIL